MANAIKESENLPEFEKNLKSIESIEVITSKEVRAALQDRAKDVFCLIRRARMEGRDPPHLSWIVPFQEFLLEPASQNEMRRLGNIDEIYTEFVHILDSKKKMDIEIREVLRILSSTPLLSDYAWNELYKSSLGGLAKLIESEDSIEKILVNTLKIGTILRNQKILELINAKSAEIQNAIVGRKNPELAIALLGAISTLPDSPWSTSESQGAISYEKIDHDLVASIIGRFAKAIPTRDKILTEKESTTKVQIRTIEDMIIKTGWAFTRQYLYYMSEIKNASPEFLYPITLSAEPMGKINENYVLYCLRNDIQLPYQILESALGNPNEYVLDIDVLEAESDLGAFEADCPDLHRVIDSKAIRENHLVNGRTGLRLDETYLGARGIVRGLLNRNEQTTIDIAKRFLTNLLVDTKIPMAIKKRARDTLHLVERNK